MRVGVESCYSDWARETVGGIKSETEGRVDLARLPQDMGGGLNRSSMSLTRSSMGLTQSGAYIVAQPGP